MNQTNMAKYLYMDEWCEENKLQVFVRVAELLMESPTVQSPYRVICGLVNGQLVIVAVGVDHVESLLEGAFPDGFEFEGQEWILGAIPTAVLHTHVAGGGQMPSIGSSIFFTSKMVDGYNVSGSITHVDPTNDLINSLSLN